jgi:hypothetical protein
MGLHAYCIVPPGLEPPAGTHGLEDATVRAVEAGGIACWVSRHATRPAATPDTIAAHHGVVSRALDCGVTPVPLRFGHWFDDDAAAAVALGRADAPWEDALRRVAGCVEFAVTVTRAPAAGSASREDDPAPPAAGPPTVPAPREVPQTARDVQEPDGHRGTAYMAILARRHADAARRRDEVESLAAAVRARAGALVRDGRASPVDAGAGLASLAHLVGRSETEAYLLMMEDVRHDRGDLRFVVSGPWPPYSFVA